MTVMHQELFNLGKKHSERLSTEKTLFSRVFFSTPSLKNVIQRSPAFYSLSFGPVVCIMQHTKAACIQQMNAGPKVNPINQISSINKLSPMKKKKKENQKDSV